MLNNSNKFGIKKKSQDCSTPRRKEPEIIIFFFFEKHEHVILFHFWTRVHINQKLQQTKTTA